MCAVAFIDLLDASIVNIALPQIRTDLHFSVQSLQWVASAYLLTYGGFLLLGGRAADLLGALPAVRGAHAWLPARTAGREHRTRDRRGDRTTGAKRAGRRHGPWHGRRPSGARRRGRVIDAEAPHSATG